ncbi:MAG: hypothetical protein KDD53_03220, partial [Bdellovibrionales bacterium]|nr:hypothetical protein [Bdellovibrionales bacterium]
MVKECPFYPDNLALLSNFNSTDAKVDLNRLAIEFAEIDRVVSSSEIPLVCHSLHSYPARFIPQIP